MRTWPMPASRRYSGAGSKTEFLLILKRVAVIWVEEDLTRPSYRSKMALNFSLRAGLMGDLSSRTLLRACGLACKVGDSFDFLVLRWAMTSWTMVKIVRTRRKPEARFCFDT